MQRCETMLYYRNKGGEVMAQIVLKDRHIGSYEYSRCSCGQETEIARPIQAKMPYCGECGKIVYDADQKFCGWCGAEFA